MRRYIYCFYWVIYLLLAPGQGRVARYAWGAADYHDVVRERLHSRTGDASDADWGVLAQVARDWEELEPATSPATRGVDTSGGRDEALARALEHLRAAGLGSDRSTG